MESDFCTYQNNSGTYSRTRKMQHVSYVRLIDTRYILVSLGFSKKEIVTTLWGYRFFWNFQSFSPGISKNVPLFCIGPLGNPRFSSNFGTPPGIPTTFILYPNNLHITVLSDFGMFQTVRNVDWIRKRSESVSDVDWIRKRCRLNP